MIVFDVTNDTDSLIISEGKYVLVNPDLLRSTLKENRSLTQLTAQAPQIVLEFRQLYQDFGK